jgi:hypothetical protein
MTLRPGGLLARTVRAVEVAEDAVHVVVAILLTALGITLVTGRSSSWPSPPWFGGTRSACTGQQPQ